ncbi:hypothetical protein Tco_0266513 [Tanacetum coccineum]
MLGMNQRPSYGRNRVAKLLGLFPAIEKWVESNGVFVYLGRLCELKTTIDVGLFDRGNSMETIGKQYDQSSDVARLAPSLSDIMYMSYTPFCLTIADREVFAYKYKHFDAVKHYVIILIICGVHQVMLYTLRLERVEAPRQNQNEPENEVSKDEFKSFHVNRNSESSDDEAQYQHNDQRNNRSQRGANMRVDILVFGGRIQPDEFIDWIHIMERVFDYQKVHDVLKVKIVSIKLKKHASVCWEQLKLKRTHVNKPRIRTWEKMKQSTEEDSKELDSHPVFDEELEKKDVIYGDTGEPLVFRRASATYSVEDSGWHCHNIFHTWCTSHGRDCDIIIDSRSCENVETETMVKKLFLKTEKHPSPYKLS